MAMDPRKRQKKLQRRKAKEKAKRKALAQRAPRSLATRIQGAAAAPILHCCATEALWDQGLSHVLISRELRSGDVAFVVFLVDAYCLGVKDVVFDVAPRSRYDWKVYGKLLETQEVVQLEPEETRKLIEGAVEYARDLGFAPHHDYRKAKSIFGDIDADAAEEEFVFGKDGKPFFFAGPYDDRARCKEILSILTNRCGPDGFYYTMPAELAGALPPEDELFVIDEM